MEEHDLEVATLLRAKKDAQVIEAEVIDNDDQMLIDLHDAFELLHKCRAMLGFVGDTDLCPRLSKRERGAADRLDYRIKEYLDDVEYHYEE